MENSQKVIYREIQRPRQIWLWLIVLLITSFTWYCYIQQIFFDIPIGNNPAPNIVLFILWVTFGILFPLFIGSLKLVIEVREDGLYIRFSPFHLQFRKFLFKDIEYYEPIVYSTLEFGGRGMRINLKGETVYSMNGKQGIRLKIKNETVVLSTEKQSEIMDALNTLDARN